MKNGQNLKLNGGMYAMIRSGRLSFLFPIEKDSATWWPRYTARSCEKKKAVYPGATGVGKTMATVFPGSEGNGGKGWEKRFFYLDSEDDYEDSCRAGIFPC